jgi:hypothetical protein
MSLDPIAWASDLRGRGSGCLSAMSDVAHAAPDSAESQSQTEDTESYWLKCGAAAAIGSAQQGST